MTTIPPTAAQALLTVAAAGQTPTVVVPQPPAELARLPPGSVVEVEVVARTDAEAPAADTAPARPTRTVVVRTPAGEVAVRVSVPVEPGVRLTLEVVRANATQVTAKVVAIDGEPVAAERAARSISAEAQVAKDVPSSQRPMPQIPVATLPPGQAWTPTGAIPLTQVAPLSALVTAAPAASPFQTGAELAIRVVAVQTLLAPPATPTPNPQANPAAATSPLPQGMVASPTPVPAVPGFVPAPAAGATSPPLAGVVAPTLQSPTQATPVTIPPTNPVAAAPTITVTQPAAIGPAQTAPLALPQTQNVSPAMIDPVEVKLPGPQGLPPPTPTPPVSVQSAPTLAVLTGQVVSLSATGAPVVRTDAGDLQLNVRANLVVGASVTVEVTASTPARPMAPVFALAGGPLALPLAPGGGWSSLTEALSLLQRVDPQTAASLAAAVPDGGPRTALAMMSFMHALRGGDPRAWPGDAALRGLERAGPRGAQLAAQISGEVGELARRASADGGEWRTLPLPWAMDGKIDRIALVTRREDAGDDEATKKKSKTGGTRFLINLNLSRLGEMQLDGMFRKDARSFDLMVRTKQPVPESLARELPGRFAEINAALGLTGALTFQVVRRFPDPAATPGDAGRPGVWA
ncbi:MAG: hypothetical protein SFV21_13430 [Rhodospirillaceae bacterium]|nr:hypothetical protein [Rhodospirillaceae bacterium]